MRKIYLAKNTSSKELLDEVLRLNGIFDYKLRYNEYGKPYLESGELFFNLSHSGEYTACAISWGEHVNVLRSDPCIRDQ